MLKKKKKQNIAITVIAIAIISAVIGYNYYIDQIKQKGLKFGNELEQIQNDVKQLQNQFYSKITQWKEGDLSKENLMIHLENHVEEFEEIIPRYDMLDPPEPFESSVELFKLSSKAQLESDIQYIKWLKTEDDSFKTRSDLQLKESFDYEMAALGEFNAAKSGISPQH